MRAWRVHEFGDPNEVMRLEAADSPAPGPGQVGVAVPPAARRKSRCAASSELNWPSTTATATS